MPIRKTQAVPLYWSEVSNTSRIVTWLTAQYGKLSTLIKGDQRKNSPFRGQYDHFSASELLFYDRAERGVQIAKECSLLRPRPIFRTDWRACAAAGYIAYLFAKTTPRQAHEPGRFVFFEDMLTCAESAGSNPAFIAWFDLHFAAFHGQAVQLTPPDGIQPDEPLRFCALRGGVLSTAEAKQREPISDVVSQKTIALMKSWQSLPSPEPIASNPPHPVVLRRIDQLLHRFMTCHFDLPPYVRQTAVNLMQRTAA